MIPYEDLTPGGQARRVRPVALAALDAFGIEPQRLTVAQHSENTIYRVETDAGDAGDPRYVPGRLALRVHGIDYQTAPAIRSEMAWLAALAGDGVPAPEPVATREGDLVVEIAAPDALGTRPCSVQRWVRGRMMHTPPPPARYRHIGTMLARLHDHAARWDPPSGFVRHRWDWDGFFGDTIPFAGTVAAECWGWLPRDVHRRWWTIAERFREVAATLGEDRTVFGLIHADPHYGNLLYSAGEMRPLDFDDCGWGWYLYDFAIGIGSPQRKAPTWEAARDAFWAGYRARRKVPDDTLRHLDDFFAARAVSVSLWHVGMARISREFADDLPRLYRSVNGLLDVMGM